MSALRRVWRWLRWLLLLAALGLVAAAWLAFNLRPGLAEHQALVGLPAPAAGDLRVTWIGTTTLLFDDGETAWMTDAFVDRPSAATVLFRDLEPDRARVQAALARAGVDRLAAVVPVHSHHDHALDAPLVAELTGALLVGSTSTANLGRGHGLAAERIRVVGDGDRLDLGEFRVSFTVVPHSPGDAYPGSIDEPLVPPAGADAWRTGDCYSLLVEHRGRRLVVHASAGVRPDALAGQRAEVVFLGVGGLGKQTDEQRDTYWREVVAATGARRLVLVHWDDFFRPLDEPAAPLPWLFDDFTATMAFLRPRADAAGVDVRIPELWQPFAPLTALPPDMP